MSFLRGVLSSAVRPLAPRVRGLKDWFIPRCRRAMTNTRYADAVVTILIATDLFSGSARVRLPSGGS